jgi:hypothetical protein
MSCKMSLLLIWQMDNSVRKAELWIEYPNTKNFEQKIFVNTKCYSFKDILTLRLISKKCSVSSTGLFIVMKMSYTDLHPSQHRVAHKKLYFSCCFIRVCKPKRPNSVIWVHERTIPAERQLLVDEVSADFCGCWVPRGQLDESPRP